MIEKSIRDKIVALAQRKSIIKPKDLRAEELPEYLLRRLVTQGILRRITRGSYCLADQSFGQYESYMEVSLRIPQGVVTLLSALVLHEVTTQNPSEIWLALKRQRSAPKVENLPVKLVWYSEPAFSTGIEIKKYFGVPIQVYSLEKTIVDCFKYRNKIGIDVAIEALKESRLEQRIKMNLIREYANICRVQNIMTPYLEALV